MIRTDAGCSVSRFAELVGVPRRTYHGRLARHRAGEVAKGPWPAPVVDREVLAFADFPKAHWQRIWSSNPVERINEEIKRRCRVVGIVSNEASAIRLVGAILADLYDEWQATDRRYLSERSMAQCAIISPQPDSRPPTDTEPQPQRPPLRGTSSGGMPGGGELMQWLTLLVVSAKAGIHPPAV